MDEQDYKTDMAEAHNIFFDKTKIEISLEVHFALKKIVDLYRKRLQSQRSSLIEELREQIEAARQDIHPDVEPEELDSMCACEACKTLTKVSDNL